MKKQIWKWVGVYGLWRGWLFVLTIMATWFVPLRLGFLARNFFDEHLPDPIWPWGNMDGDVFMLIARQGYQASQLPFFPLYPLTIRGVVMVSGLPYVLAGMVVSTLAFGGAMYLLWRLLKLDQRSRLFGLIFLLMIFFPTGHYYTAVYNDSLFLLLSMGTLYFGRRKKFGWASIWGGLALLTRLNGLALLVYVGAEYLIALNPRVKQLKSWQTLRELGISIKDGLLPKNWWHHHIWWALLIPGAFLGYLMWIDWQFGDWQLFFKGVEVWHRDKLTFPLQTFWRYIKILITVTSASLVFTVALAEFLFSVFYIGIIAWSWNKIRFSYWLFMLVSLLIPTLTGTLQGMPRYGLHLYPLFLSIALVLESKPKWMRVMWFLGTMLLQTLYVAAYTRGYFVA